MTTGSLTRTNQLEVPPIRPGSRTWFDGVVGGVDPPLGNEVAVPPAPWECRDDTLRTLYVNGPGGVSRQLLWEGFVGIGRGAGADVVVDDPCVSHLHAGLHVACDVTLTDLASSNGTFVGRDRILPHQARLLHPGQAFFIGQSALVIHAASLPPARLRRLGSLDDLRREAAIARRGSGPGFGPLVVLKVRPTMPIPPAALEAILGTVAGSSRDWITWAGTDQVLLGIEIAASAEAGAEATAAALRRLAGQRLASWGVRAEVESAALRSKEELEDTASGLDVLLRGDVSLSLTRGRIVLRDPAMQALRRTVLRVAPATASVLILGETGVGKDVVAAMVHELSARAERPLVGINCANLPEPLLESELFGHERGAFTGAVAAKPGLLETADGGTVFLDELGDLPRALQAKLLRVIESREVMRLGAVRSRIIDVRFVAATNRDLSSAVADGSFRRDLYYRLNCVTLTVPPLRERAADIEALAELFLNETCARLGVGEMRFSSSALAALLGHAWPGNVRELRNVVERVVLLASGPVIEPAHLDLPSGPGSLAALARGGQAAPSLPPTTAATPPPVDPNGTAILGTLAEGLLSKRDRIARALVACGGNQSRAAKSLGISRRTLVRQISLLGLPRPRTPRS